MNEGEWLPVYREVLSDMGYDGAADEEAGRLLDSIARGLDLCHESDARRRFGPHVVVVGRAWTPGEGLPARVPVVSAGAATAALVGAGVIPDVVVTDLDGRVGAQIEASRKGALTFIHAHGDNMDLIRDRAPFFEGKAIPTVQCAAHGVLRNYGGFTDGDRAVCISEHFGAARVTLVGFDFDNPVPNTPSKARKLVWARKIIGMRADAGLTVDFKTVSR